MSISSSEILCLGVGVKESPSFSISISCLVKKNMLDKFITFGDIFCMVVDNSVDRFLNDKADKASIVVVMSSQYCWTMCQLHLNNEQYYRCLFENDPSLIVNEKIINYAAAF